MLKANDDRFIVISYLHFDYTSSHIGSVDFIVFWNLISIAC